MARPRRLPRLVVGRGSTPRLLTSTISTTAGEGGGGSGGERRAREGHHRAHSGGPPRRAHRRRRPSVRPPAAAQAWPAWPPTDAPPTPVVTGRVVPRDRQRTDGSGRALGGGGGDAHPRPPQRQDGDTRPPRRRVAHENWGRGGARSHPLAVVMVEKALMVERRGGGRGSGSRRSRPPQRWGEGGGRAHGEETGEERGAASPTSQSSRRDFLHPRSLIEWNARRWPHRTTVRSPRSRGTNRDFQKFGRGVSVPTPRQRPAARQQGAPTQEGGSSTSTAARTHLAWLPTKALAEVSSSASILTEGCSGRRRA